MDLITFRCAACKKVLKIRAGEKAGRKGKCTCGAELTIPLVSEDLAATAAAAPPPQVAATADDEEDASAYGLSDYEASAPLPSVEVPTDKPKKKGPTDEEQEDLAEARRRRRAALRRAPMDVVKWERVRVGILLVLVATCIWIGAFALHKLILVIGMFAGPEYATLADSPDFIRNPSPALGEDLDLDKTSFVIGLLSGSSSLDAGLWIARIAQVFILLQALVAIAGYAICLAVPPNFGTRALLITALSLAGVNLLLQLVFKLLPLTGAMDYVMIPLVAPEIPMGVGNIERMLPLHIFWSDAPFWEMFVALLIQMLFYAEPVIFCLFLRAAALSIKDEVMQAKADALILMAMGTAFALLAYYLLSVNGTSEVVGWVLRCIYGLWVAFFLGQLIWYSIYLYRCRERIAAKLSEEEE